MTAGGGSFAFLATQARGLGGTGGVWTDSDSDAEAAERGAEGAEKAVAPQETASVMACLQRR